MTVAIPYISPLRGAMVGAHCFTWQGKFYACCSFPEVCMGSLEQQETDMKEGVRTGSAMEWVHAFLGRLESAGMVC